MKIKNGKIIVSILLVVCIACLCSCDKISTGIFNPDRITEFYFVSCTDPYNAFYLNEKKNDVKSVKLLRQDEAVELAHEVEAIPDAESTEGMCSYIIRINYVEGGIEKSVEKTGYNTFPENWDRVIELTNIIRGEYRHVTNSRELAVIDAEYLRSHEFIADESIIPEGMTLDEIIEGAGINYLTLYEPQNRPSVSKERYIAEVITDYLFEYFDLTSHQIYELDENPPKSSADEMKKFAESRLDEVRYISPDGYDCWGTYNGETYVIIRYDMLQAWLEKESERRYQSSFCGSPYQYQATIQVEFSCFSTQTYEVFVDGSGKYIIMTAVNCSKPEDMAAVVT